MQCLLMPRVETVKAFLMTNDSATTIFNVATTGSNYYISIKQCNAISTWGAVPVQLNPTSIYDFTPTNSMALTNIMVKVDGQSGIIGIL
jgi:hypothetical protein